MKNRVVAYALCLCLASACKSDSQGASNEDKPAPALAPVERKPVEVDPAPAPKEVPSASLQGAHLDGTDTEYRPRDYRPSARNGKTIELFLRSSPPGASAAMDGKAIGITPTFWSGIADNQTHEFTFVKAGYGMARYRFVATENGVVHGTLKPLAKATPSKDAGPAQPR